MVCSGADIAEILGWEAPAPSGKAVGQSLFAETGPLAPSVGNESAGATGAAYREAVLPDSVAASAAGDGRVASLRGLLGDDPVSLDELSIRSGIAVAELPGPAARVGACGTDLRTARELIYEKLSVTAGGRNSVYVHPYTEHTI